MLSTVFYYKIIHLDRQNPYNFHTTRRQHFFLQLALSADRFAPRTMVAGNSVLTTICLIHQAIPGDVECSLSAFQFAVRNGKLAILFEHGDNIVANLVQRCLRMTLQLSNTFFCHCWCTGLDDLIITTNIGGSEIFGNKLKAICCCKSVFINLFLV